MEAMPYEESSLTVPLIDDENKEGLGSKLEEVELNSSQTSASTTSVLRTCFNGLNALSGSV